MLLLMGLSLRRWAASGRVAGPPRRVACDRRAVGVGVVLRRRGRRSPRSRRTASRGGTSFASAVAALEPWQSLVLVPAAVAVLVGFAAFSQRGLANDRAPARGGAGGSRGHAGRVTPGTIPKRVRRRSPAALAGYELPLGLMGFPGRRLAVRGLPAHRLDPADGRAGDHVGGHPGRVHARTGQGPLRGVGWKVELVWLPAIALVSSRCSTARTRGAARSSNGKPPARRTREPAPTARASASRSARSRCCSSRCRSSRRSPASAAAACATRTSRG